MASIVIDIDRCAQGCQSPPYTELTRHESNYRNSSVPTFNLDSSVGRIRVGRWRRVRVG